MATIDKIKVNNENYDIAASGANVAYDSTTSVNGKIDAVVQSLGTQATMVLEGTTLKITTK